MSGRPRPQQQPTQSGVLQDPWPPQRLHRSPPSDRETWAASVRRSNTRGRWGGSPLATSPNCHQRAQVNRGGAGRQGERKGEARRGELERGGLSPLALSSGATGGPAGDGDGIGRAGGCPRSGGGRCGGGGRVEKAMRQPNGGVALGVERSKKDRAVSGEDGCTSGRRSWGLFQWRCPAARGGGVAGVGPGRRGEDPQATILSTPLRRVVGVHRAAIHERTRGSYST